ncbi:RDD family protein [candidate division CSSED10-310 bacterium]|uniref:RDD family protein n=1 Tax=candidate division CSSED10-310 bacterium TaxID=2855610 RepID=A0ABV6YZP7_UNCC1
MPIASPKRRLMAAIYLYLVIACIVLPFKFPIALFLKMYYGNVTGASSAVIRQAQDVSGVLLLIVILATIYYVLIHVPHNNGRNWGQQLMGISVIQPDGTAISGLGPWFKRLLGDLVNYGTMFIPAVIQSFDQELISLPDQFSKTRQVESEPLPERPVIKALSPFAILFIINLVVNLATVQVLRPRSTTMPATRTVTKSRSSSQLALTILQLEKLYFYEYEMMSSDLRLLYKTYGNTMASHDKIMIAQALSKGLVKIKTIDAQCDIAVKDAENGVWTVYSGSIDGKLWKDDQFLPSEQPPW